MSDIYYRDTKKALDNFEDVLSELTTILDDRIIKCFEDLFNEVDGLLAQYESNLDDLGIARDTLHENGIEI